MRPIVGSHCGLPITLLRGPNYHCFTDNASLDVTGITEEWSTETQKSPQRNAPVCQDLISPAGDLPPGDQDPVCTLGESLSVTAVTGKEHPELPSRTIS